MNENEIIITLESDERRYSQETLGVTLESTDKEIIDALAPVISEDVGINLQSSEDGYWMVKKIDSTQNIYVFPKSTAGGDITIGA